MADNPVAGGTQGPCGADGGMASGSGTSPPGLRQQHNHLPMELLPALGVRPDEIES